MKVTKDELILDREDQRRLAGILNAPLSERDHAVIPPEALLDFEKVKPMKGGVGIPPKIAKLMRQHAEEHAKFDLLEYMREKVREIRGE